MTASNNIFDALERKGEISTSQPDRHTSLRSVADTISKRNVDGAVCELLNEALSRLVVLAYEEDAGGLCNVDVVTGRFLIPLPFGRNGHKAWGLRPQEANVLRQALFEWQAEPTRLVFYERARRAWFVNLFHFPALGVAKGWLRSHQMSVTLYRRLRAQVLAKSYHPK